MCDSVVSVCACVRVCLVSFLRKVTAPFDTVSQQGFPHREEWVLVTGRKRGEERESERERSIVAAAFLKSWHPFLKRNLVVFAL